MLVNTTQDFGGSHRNYERGIHYLVTPADSARAQKTFTHEFGHGLLELGDEYMSSTTQQTDLTSLNVAHTHDPNNVKWKQLLGFRKTYTCNALGYGNAYNSSYECLMRDTTYQFCEVCKLQGSKRMSQLIDGKSLYVANPEVKNIRGSILSRQTLRIRHITDIIIMKIIAVEFCSVAGTKTNSTPVWRARKFNSAPSYKIYRTLHSAMLP